MWELFALVYTSTFCSKIISLFVLLLTATIIAWVVRKILDMFT